MSEIVFEVSGFEELRQALRTMPEKSAPILLEAVTKSCEAVKGVLVEYPPATEANKPGRINRKGKPMGYYERGRGWWYPVRQRSTMESTIGASGQPIKAKGGIKAPRSLGLAGYKLRATSEMLNRRWATEAKMVQNGAEGTIGTPVSYARWVHIDQPAIFRARGWKSMTEALEAASDDIQAAFAEAIDKVVKLLGGR